MKQKKGRKFRHGSRKKCTFSAGRPPPISCGTKEKALLRYLSKIGDERFNMRRYSIDFNTPRSTLQSVLERLQQKGLVTKKGFGDWRITREGSNILGIIFPMPKRLAGGADVREHLSVHYTRFIASIKDKRSFSVQKLSSLGVVKRVKMRNWVQYLVELDGVTVVVNPQKVVFRVHEVIAGDVDAASYQALDVALSAVKRVEGVGLVLDGLALDGADYARMQSAFAEILSKVDNRYFLRLDDGRRFWIDRSGGKLEDETDDVDLREKLDQLIQDDRATAGDPFSLTLNLTADATFSLNASLLWNNTPQSVSTSSGVGWRAFTANFLNESLGTYWYYWSVNVTQSDGNFSSFSLNNTHEVEEWYIDACSAATNKTIRWNLFDEDSPSTPLTGTAEVLIEYWPVSMNNSKIFNHSYSSNTFFEVCMSPGDLNFSANIYLQNTHSSAFTHRFFVQNGSFNNVTTVYPIYNFVNKTGKSDMRLTTRQNNDYSYMENVLVYLQRLYVGEGDWRTVQMDRSGDYGLVFFNIIEEDTDYKILFYDMNNNLLHQTTSMKFACTAGVCEITQLLSDYVAATTTDQVEAVLSYDNTSRLISVVWSAPPLESHNVEFTATRETVTGPLTLCNNIQVGSGGTFTCNVTGVNGQVFVKTVVDGGLSPPVAEWVDVTTSSLGDNMTPAESSLWSFGIASTLVMIGLFSPVGALIGLVIGLIVIFFLGILNPLNLTFIILAVAASVAIGLKVKT